MAIPVGTYPIGGPIIDISGGLLTASTTLRDNNVVQLRDGQWHRVNEAGDGWEVAPQHVVGATEPSAPFEGMLWYDTTNDAPKFYNGTAFVEVSGGGGAGTVETEDPVEGDGETATPVTLTDTAKHSLSQIPALEERTQDLVAEDTYVWADTTDGVISLRSDAPPAPWLQTTVWGATYSYSSQDAGAANTYIVLRIGNSEEVNQFRIEVTKGSNTFYYNGAAFKRIHKSETSHKYYAHPNSNLQSGDELQVQKGTVTGEVTEYRGHVGGASFTAPDGNGNLADTVDTIDELVTAVDDLTTGGGGVLRRPSAGLRPTPRPTPRRRH